MTNEVDNVKRGDRLGSGWLKGRRVRQARKAGTCDYLNGVIWRKYPHTVQPGALYVEGDPNESAGGYGNDRYCLACVRLSYVPNPGGTLEDYPAEDLDRWKREINQ